MVSGAIYSKLRYHGAAALSAGTLIALILHPTPWCFDCEFANPWGHIYDWLDTALSIWLLVAPFLAGLFALRKGWLVPLSLVGALLASQSLGGVAWWSLRENEGPIILMFGLPTCAACFFLGSVVRLAAVFVNGVISRLRA